MGGRELEKKALRARWLRKRFIDLSGYRARQPTSCANWQALPNASDKWIPRSHPSIRQSIKIGSGQSNSFSNGRTRVGSSHELQNRRKRRWETRRGAKSDKWKNWTGSMCCYAVFVCSETKVLQQPRLAEIPLKNYHSTDKTSDICSASLDAEEREEELEVWWIMKTIWAI